MGECFKLVTWGESEYERKTDLSLNFSSAAQVTIWHTIGHRGSWVFASSASDTMYVQSLVHHQWSGKAASLAFLLASLFSRASLFLWLWHTQRSCSNFSSIITDGWRNKLTSPPVVLPPLPFLLSFLFSSSLFLSSSLPPCFFFLPSSSSSCSQSPPLPHSCSPPSL